MSAIDEIHRHFGQIKPPARGAQRTILVGISAERSICCMTHDHKLPDYIGGFLVLTTFEFEGWAIRDCLRDGRWIEARPITLRA